MNDETKKPEEPPRPQLMPVVDTGEFAQLLDSDRFAQVQRVAKLFSESDLVPEVFQGKVANCAVALQMAFRMRVDPMMLMQNMYIVHGRPGIEAKLAIALINSRGPFKGPLQWKVDGDGDSRSWTCFAIHSRTEQTCEATVRWSMVVAEGWNKARPLKGGGSMPSKWTTMADIMGRYRSAMILGRLYCPEVLLGLPSDDELHDSEITVDGSHVIKARPDIPMPQAKAPPPGPPGAGGGQGRTGLGIIDAATGEITPPVILEPDGGLVPIFAAGGSGGGAGATEPAPQRQEAPAGAPPTPAPDDFMKKPASDAQRGAILRTAERKGLSAAQVDEILVDATGFTLATLPMGAVNPALGAIANFGKS